MPFQYAKKLLDASRRLAPDEAYDPEKTYREYEKKGLRQLLSTLLPKFSTKDTILGMHLSAHGDKGSLH